MATYKALSGETVYDVAAKIYGDSPGGVQDLISLNAITDLNADLTGLTLAYTSSFSRKKPVIVSVPSPSTVQTYLSRKSQTLYDIATQLYGNVSLIGKLVKYFPNLDSELTLNTAIPLEAHTDKIAQFFNDKGLIVATDLETIIVNVDNVLTETGFNILLEDGSLMLLE